MKKFVTLLVVLGLASTASAGLITIQIEPTDVAVYTGGEQITIELISSGFAQGTYGAGELGQMAIDAIKITSGGGAAVDLGAPLHNITGGMSPAFDTVANQGTYSALADTLATAVAGAATAFNGIPSAGDDVPNGTAAQYFELVLTTTPGTYTITLVNLTTADLFSGAITSTYTPLAITVIPEPMTIALLGLGGLFLRRRK